MVHSHIRATETFNASKVYTQCELYVDRTHYFLTRSAQSSAPKKCIWKGQVAKG